MTTISPPATPGRPPLGPAVRSVVLARLISSTGAEAAFFLGLWGKAAFVFGGTPLDLAIMGAAVGVAAMAGSVVGGAAVDRLGAKRVVLLAEAVFVPATLAMVLTTDITGLIAVGAVSWLAAGILETAIVSLPPIIAPPERLETANARLESANWIAIIVGPALGAPLVARFGVDVVFVFDAATSLVALALLATLRLPDGASVGGETGPDGEVGGASGLRDVFSGLVLAWRSLPIRIALGLAAMSGLAFGMFVALEPLFFRDVVGADVTVLGYVNAVFGVGLLGGSLLLERAGTRSGRYTVLVTLTTLSGLGAVLYVATPSMSVILVGAVAWAIPLGAALPLIRTLAQRAAPPSHTGRVMGALGVVTTGLPILPVIIAPALAAVVGVQALLIASAAVAAIGAPLLWPVARSLDATRPPTAADQPAPALGSAR